MSEQYLSVGQVNNYIKNIFEAEVLLQNICIYGEVSSYKISNNIAYFNLADNTGLISCVLFNASKFFTPNIGDMILVVGSVSYYAKGGKLSFNASHIAPYGKGVLYENFLKLKAELESKGYFDLAHKKPLPERVNRIGVVTSSTGAVIQDIINVSTRRNPNIDIVLYPVKVQGIGAEEEIAKGINFFSTYENIDVIIVARGGGSIEDLQPFNTEIVATATYNCKKPIVSAVGHETDFTIIDFVSDLRVPTPSAAAECVVKNLTDDFAFVNNCFEDMYQIINYKLDNYLNTIDDKLENILFRIDNKLIINNNKIDKFISEINHNIDKIILKFESNLSILNNRINILNPLVPLDKGYVRIEDESGLIKSSKKIKKDNKYVAIFKDGKADIMGV